MPLDVLKNYLRGKFYFVWYINLLFQAKNKNKNENVFHKCSNII